MPTRLVDRYIFGTPENGWTTATNLWTTATTTGWTTTTANVWTPFTTENKKWNAVLREGLERAYDTYFEDYMKGHIEVEEFVDDAGKKGVRFWERKPWENKPEESQLPDFGEDYDEMVLKL